MKKILLVIAGLLVLGWFASSRTTTPSKTAERPPARVLTEKEMVQLAEQKKTAKAPAPEIDKSPEMQKQREAMIQKLIQQGIFWKVEVPGNLPRLWVRPGFYQLDWDQKQTFVGVVYAYYFDGRGLTDTVRIFDDRTGKEIGDYSQVNPGLRLK